MSYIYPDWVLHTERPDSPLLSKLRFLWRLPALWGIVMSSLCRALGQRAVPGSAHRDRVRKVAYTGIERERQADPAPQPGGCGMPPDLDQGPARPGGGRQRLP
jgi:hypothetical protein